MGAVEVTVGPLKSKALAQLDMVNKAFSLKRQLPGWILKIRKGGIQGRVFHLAGTA